MYEVKEFTTSRGKIEYEIKYGEEYIYTFDSKERAEDFCWLMNYAKAARKHLVDFDTLALMGTK